MFFYVLLNVINTRRQRKNKLKERGERGNLFGNDTINNRRKTAGGDTSLFTVGSNVGGIRRNGEMTNVHILHKIEMESEHRTKKKETGKR